MSTAASSPRASRRIVDKFVPATAVPGHQTSRVKLLSMIPCPLRSSEGRGATRCHQMLRRSPPIRRCGPKLETLHTELEDCQDFAYSISFRTSSEAIADRGLRRTCYAKHIRRGLLIPRRWRGMDLPEGPGRWPPRQRMMEKMSQSKSSTAVERLSRVVRVGPESRTSPPLTDSGYEHMYVDLMASGQRQPDRRASGRASSAGARERRTLFDRGSAGTVGGSETAARDHRRHGGEMVSVNIAKGQDCFV
jgi:hypothetical protein